MLTDCFRDVYLRGVPVVTDVMALVVLMRIRGDDPRSCEAPKRWRSHDVRVVRGAAEEILELRVAREDLSHDQAKRWVARRLDALDEGWREYARIV